MNGWRDASSSKAFKSTGIPSENLSILSFMTLAAVLCSAAETDAMIRGVIIVTFFWVVSMVSSKGQGYRTKREKI